MEIKPVICILILSMLFALFIFTACDDQKNPTDIEYIAAPTVILRSDTASEAEVACAIELRNGITEKCGTVLTLTTDWVKKGEEIPALASEIVVGVTNRPASSSEYDALIGARINSDRDFSIKAEGGAVLITAASEDALPEAVAYFLGNYVGDNGIVIPKNEYFLYEYPYPEYSVGGVSLYGSSVSVPDNYFLALAAEDFLCETANLTGWQLPVGESGELVIGFLLDPSLGADEYKLSQGSGRITVSGGSYDAVRCGAQRLTEFACKNSPASDINIKENFTMYKSKNKSDIAASSGAQVYTSLGDPLYLIDDLAVINSGWDFDGSGADFAAAVGYVSNGHSSISLNDISTEYGTSMKRPFNAQNSGKLVFETKLNVSESGWTLRLYDSTSGLSAFNLTANSGKLTLYSDKNTEFPLTSKTLSIYLELDLDRGEFTLNLNGENLGAMKFAEAAKSLDTVKIFTSETEMVLVQPSFVRLYKNLPVAERFNLGLDGENPAGVAVTGDCKLKDLGNTGVSDSLSLFMNGEASVLKTFAPFDGKICFEVKFMSGGADQAVFTLAGSGMNIISANLNGAFICSGGEKLRTYQKNFWYTLRFEADTRTKHAEIKVNGKSLGFFPFENNVMSADNFKITLPEGQLFIDDVYVSQINDFDDYVPAPLSAGSDGYYVAAQVCSLWRNGYHWGWDCISPYDELTPVLGHYDEGIAETADWEIKYMAEHGVDYQLYCWYAPVADRPIKSPRMMEALHDGYFNAKYSDKIKFAIMWENANASHPGSSDNFRNYIVPYWVEYYLSDPRYMTIENKPVITVFSLPDLISDFGSEEAVRREFEYLREVCVGLGYDGAIILCQAATTSADTLGKIKNTGADAVYAYNWGKANTSSVYESYITGQYNTGINVIPTISVGFNNVAWAGTRSELIESSDYRAALEWVRDDFQKKYDDGSWLSKTIVLSTWNEYGEGTYIMPSLENGFAYLDAVREVFAPDNRYENLVPSEDQKARICGLFPQTRRLLRADYRVGEDTSNLIKVTGWDFASGANGWSQGFGLNSFSASDGVLKGSSTASDFAVMSPDNLSIELDGISFIKVRMKCDKSGTMEIFYTTDTSGPFVQHNSVNTAVTASDEFADYYLACGTKASFAGKLRQLRIDPLGTGCSFEIESVELMRPKAVYTLTINGEVFNTKNYPISNDGGVYMVPFDPKSGLLMRLGCVYEWDAKSLTLTVSRKSTTVRFTVGSDHADVGGSLYKLTRAVAFIDGLPVLPIADLCEILSIDGVGCS
ncbi:MAG: glycoside hydrolase family 99-like domain-containing protein [Eubacteriales bacterium]